MVLLEFPGLDLGQLRLEENLTCSAQVQRIRRLKLTGQKGWQLPLSRDRNWHCLSDLFLRLRISMNNPATDRLHRFANQRGRLRRPGD